MKIKRLKFMGFSFSFSQGIFLILLIQYFTVLVVNIVERMYKQSKNRQQRFYKTKIYKNVPRCYSRDWEEFCVIGRARGACLSIWGARGWLSAFLKTGVWLSNQILAWLILQQVSELVKYFCVLLPCIGHEVVHHRQ